MPQLDFSTYSSQLFWLAITFGALYLVLALRLLPRVTDVLTQRADRIRDFLDDADRLKREAEEVQAAYEKSLAEARAAASRELEQARATIQADIEAKTKALDAKLNEQARTAEARIKAAKAEAMAGLEEVAAATCSAMVAKLAGRSPSESQVKSAVAAEIKATVSQE